MNTYQVEFTDTYGGEANYCWVEKHTVIAKNMKQATTKAKQLRYYSPIPKHTIDFDDNYFRRININNACVCCFITLMDTEYETDE